MKKFLCVLLSVLLLFSCVSVVAVAAGEDEETIDISAELAKRLVDDEFVSMVGNMSMQSQLSSVASGNYYDIDTLRNQGKLDNVNLLGLTVKELYSNDGSISWTSNANAPVSYTTGSWSGTAATAADEDIQLSTSVSFDKAVNAKIGGVYLSKNQSELNQSTAFQSIYRSGNAFSLSFKLKQYGVKTMEANTTYYYRFYMIVDEGEYNSAIYSFTTGDDAFSVTAAAPVAGTSATFKVNGQNLPDHAPAGNIKVSYTDFALLYGEMNDYLRRVLTTKLGNVAIFNNDPSKLDANGRTSAGNLATKITNFIGHLIYPNFEDVEVTFNGQNAISEEVFYKAIGLYSGLTDWLTQVWFQPQWEEAPVTNAAGLYAYDALDKFGEPLTIYISSLSFKIGTKIVVPGDTTYTIVDLLSESNGQYTHKATTAENETVKIVLNGGKLKIGDAFTISNGKSYTVINQQTQIVQRTDLNGNRMYEPKLNFLSLMDVLQVNYRSFEAPDAQINRPADVASLIVKQVFENLYTLGPIKYLVQVVQTWLQSHATGCFDALEAFFGKWVASGRITSAELRTYEGVLNLIANGNNPAATDKLQFIDVPLHHLRDAKSETECFLCLLLYLNLLGNNKGNPAVVANMKQAVRDNTTLKLKAKTKDNICTYLDAMLLGKYDGFATKITEIASENIGNTEQTVQNTLLSFLANITKNFWNFFDRMFRLFDVFHLLIK